MSVEVFRTNLFQCVLRDYSSRCCLMCTFLYRFESLSRQVATLFHLDSRHWVASFLPAHEVSYVPHHLPQTTHSQSYCHKVMKNKTKTKQQSALSQGTNSCFSSLPIAVCLHWAGCSEVGHLDVDWALVELRESFWK